MLDKKMNLLIAYPYFRKDISGFLRLLDSIDPNDYRLIIDSGAFSAHYSGHEVTLEGYSQFLRSIQYERFERCIQLDVIFNAEKTKEHFHIMRDQGLDVSPVFTRGTPIEYFDELIANDEYIFVGGLQNDTGTNDPIRFAIQCLERSRGKKVHYLAFIRPDYLIHYKPYSVDASSWSSSAQYGNLILYDGNGRTKTFNRKHFVTYPKQEIIDLLKKLRLDIEEIKSLQKLDKWRNKGLSRLDNPDRFTGNIFYSIVSYLLYSIDAQNKIDTKIYNAISHVWQLDLFIHAHNFLKDRRLI